MLPAAASIRKQGANRGATTAFLISTPESGVDSISITWALLDPLMTIIRPVAALFTAIFAGILENVVFQEKEQAEINVDLSCPIDGCCDGVDCPPETHRHHHSLAEKLVYGVRFALTSVWGDIAISFFFGLIIAALITVLTPDSFMATFLGGDVSSMLIMLVVGIPLYICATASTPVAAALILKGVSPGTALVFLLVGPATNITSLSVLANILGKKSTALYLVTLSVAAVAFGLLTDQIYLLAGISPLAVMGSAKEFLPYWIELLSTALLLAVSVKPVLAWFKAKMVKKKMPANTSIVGFPDLGQQKKHDHSSCCGDHQH